MPSLAIVRHSVRNRGSDRILFDYARYLIQQGYTVVYYTNKINTSLEIPLDINFKIIPLKSILGTIFFTTFNKFKEDAVLVDLALMACLACFKNKKKTVYLAQDYDVSYYKSIFLKKFTEGCYILALNKWQIPVISESEDLSQKLSTYKPLQLITVPNGVDLSNFYPNCKSSYLSQKKDAKIILYFVRNDFRKGKDIAIKAFRELKRIYTEQDWEIWTIGDNLEIFEGKRIKNLGFLNLDNLRDALSAADIYLVSSRSEGLSTLLLQAMACHCAIVGTKAVNILEHNKTGLISEIEDWKGLAENLKRALEDHHLLKNLRNAAGELAKNFDLENSCRKFSQALKKFL